MSNMFTLVLAYSMLICSPPHRLFRHPKMLVRSFREFVVGSWMYRCGMLVVTGPYTGTSRFDE